MNLGPLLNPLRFAARRGFANLATVKDLERTLIRGAAAVRSANDLSPEIRAALDDLEPLIEGLDGVEGQERRSRVEQILRRLESLGGSPPGSTKAPPRALPDGGDEAPAPSRASPPARPRPSSPSKKTVLKRSARPKAPEPTESASSERIASTALIGAAPQVEPRKTGRRIPMARAQPDSPLQEIVGVGPKTAERFEAKGFRTAQDVLFFVPRSYDDRTQFTSIAALVPGEHATVQGEVAAARIRPTGRGKRVFELAVSDGTGVISCRFFRFASRMDARYPKGTRVVVSGAVTAWGAQRQMVHPDLERLDEDGAAPAPAGILPVYGEVDGVPPKSVRRIIQGLAEACGDRVPDILPEWLLETYALPTLSKAIRQVHLPQEAVDDKRSSGCGRGWSSMSSCCCSWRSTEPVGAETRRSDCPTRPKRRSRPSRRSSSRSR